MPGAAGRWHVALLLGAPLALGLGYLYLRARREAARAPSAAAASASVSLDEEPRSARADLQQALGLKVAGNRAFHAGDYDEALVLYEKAIAACPPDRPDELATFYQNRSACHEKRERWDLVKRDCGHALRLNGRYVRAFLRRARAAEKSGELSAALEDVTAACILEQFKVRSSLLAADRVLKTLGRRNARLAMAQRRPELPSARFVRAYLSSFSRDPALTVRPEGEHFAKARAAVDAEKYDDVLPACDAEVAANGPQRREALGLRGTFLMLLGEQERAAADLTELIDDDGAPVGLRINALIKRATLHLQAEKPEMCAADFDRATALDPNDCDLRHHRGQAHILTGNLAEAVVEFAKAVELNPASAIARAQKCYAEYNVLKMTDSAADPSRIVAAFEEVIERFPTYPEAYILFAEVLSDLDSYDRSNKMFDEAVRVDPKNANVFVHKGILELKTTGDVEKAVSLISEAIRIDDKCIFAYETLGTIEVQRDNLLKAISLFEKAILLTRTETEMTHIFSLRDAADAQLKVAERWGINASTINFQE